MKIYLTTKEAIDACNEKDALIPSEFLSVFPNNFGINLSSIKGFDITLTDDNQYESIRIDFFAYNKQ